MLGRDRRTSYARWARASASNDGSNGFRHGIPRTSRTPEYHSSSEALIDSGEAIECRDAAWGVAYVSSSDDDDDDDARAELLRASATTTAAVERRRA